MSSESLFAEKAAYGLGASQEAALAQRSSLCQVLQSGARVGHRQGDREGRSNSSSHPDCLEESSWHFSDQSKGATTITSPQKASAASSGQDSSRVPLTSESTAQAVT